MHDQPTISATRPSAPSGPRSLPQLLSASPAARLRAVLGTNSATSALAGIAGLAGGTFWSKKLGAGSPTAVRIVGAGLLLFALDVALVAFRSTRTLRRDAAVVSGADIAWVIGTVAVVALADLTTLGRAVAVVLGVGVAGFAALQLTFRSQLR